jgi:DNA processing protein
VEIAVIVRVGLNGAGEPVRREKPGATMPEIHEQAAVLALVDAWEGEWFRLASLIEDVGSASAVLQGQWSEFESFDAVSKDEAEDLAARVRAESVSRHAELIERVSQDGVRLLTVLDDKYPLNLREVYNRPPFLFVRGELLDGDNRSVAVVGTRTASPDGLEQASRLAAELARANVTVLSGLAAGIDAAAHAAALDAGGRTVAVMGTGIDRIYPKGHEELADRILRSGALVSQFWPGHPPTKVSFPMRNVVMSGMAIGTVVIEATSKSGAKMQARLALDHSKRLFLLKSLVMQEEWAQKYAKHAATTVVDTVDDILEVLVEMAQPPTQLSLA